MHLTTCWVVVPVQPLVPRSPIVMHPVRSVIWLPVYARLAAPAWHAPMVWNVLTQVSPLDFHCHQFVSPIPVISLQQPVVLGAAWEEGVFRVSKIELGYKPPRS